MKIKSLFLIASVLCFSFFFYWRHTHAWSALYKKDLAAAQAILKENHPGFYDTENPEFKAWLAAGYEQALGKADIIASRADYLYGLNFFLNGFKDNHLRLAYDRKDLPSEWPGFCISYFPGKRSGFGDEIEQQNEAFKVVYSENSSVPVGSELVTCDGQGPRAWLEKNVNPYIDDRGVDASWVTVTPYLSFFHDTAFIKKPTTYVFKIEGKEQEIHPLWKKIEAMDYFSKVRKKSISLLASMQEMGEQQVWITLPSFYPKNTEQEDALKKVIDSIANYKNYDRIIFDVRGNGGGNSRYGTMILENLYGKEYCKACFKKLYAPQYIEWRASQDNTDYLKNLLIVLEEKFGKELETSFAGIVSETEKSLIAGNPFYREVNDSVEPAEQILPQNPLHARIILVTDTNCASSCLTFIDEIYALGPVLQVGLPTNVDTAYLECRDEVLPSSLVTLHFPIKVFRNRRRRPNQAYVPQIYVQDVHNDDAIKKAIADAFK